jgi:hypothetical protein
MGNTFFLPSLLRRGALRAVERSGECDSTHRGAEPPAGRAAMSALSGASRTGCFLFPLALAPFSSATSVLGWTHSSRIVFPEFSNQHAAEKDRRFLPARLESYWVANEGFSYKTFSPLPLDLPIAPDPSHDPSSGIFQDSVPAALGLRTVNFRWSPLPQGLVRANLVVNAYPPIRPALLRAPISRGRPGAFGLHHSMHLLVPSVLFGMTRSNKLNADSQHRPPSAQTRKPRRASRSKRTAVVHADDSGTAIPSKQPQEDSPHRLPPLIGQQSDTQQIATVQVPDRQRFHPMPVLSSEPSFEIHRPYLVASSRHRQLPTAQLGPAARSSTTAPIELHLFEPPSNRAHRRNRLPFVFSDQASSQFPTSPAPMSPPHPPNSLQPFVARSLRRSARTTRLIHQSPSTLLFEASLPFVAALAADSKRPTQSRHALLGLQSQLHELQPSRQLSKGLP